MGSLLSKLVSALPQHKRKAAALVAVLLAIRLYRDKHSLFHRQHAVLLHDKAFVRLRGTRIAPPDPALHPEYFANRQGLWLFMRCWQALPVQQRLSPPEEKGASTLSTESTETASADAAAAAAVAPSARFSQHSGKPVRGLVMIVHGLSEHSGRYHHVASALADQGYTSYAVDLQGHGRSYGDRMFVKSFNHFAEDLHMALERMLQLESDQSPPDTPIFILAHSMGSLVTLNYLINFLGEGAGARPLNANANAGVAAVLKQRLAGVVFSGACLEIHPEAAHPLKVFGGRLLGITAPKLRLHAARPSQVSRDPTVCSHFEYDPLNGKGITLGLAKEMFATIPYVRRCYDSLPNIPMMFVHGDQDTLTPLSGANWLYRRIKSRDKKMIVYPGALHEILNEPEWPQVMQDISTWLNEHTA